MIERVGFFSMLKKMKTLHVNFCQVSEEGNKAGIKSKMKTQVKGLGYPSKQEGNDYSQHRRQDHLSNAIGVQFFEEDSKPSYTT